MIIYCQHLVSIRPDDWLRTLRQCYRVCLGFAVAATTGPQGEHPKSEKVHLSCYRAQFNFTIWRLVCQINWMSRGTELVARRKHLIGDGAGGTDVTVRAATVPLRVSRVSAPSKRMPSRRVRKIVEIVSIYICRAGVFSRVHMVLATRETRQVAKVGTLFWIVQVFR
jgi:hypothetical protein